MQQIKRGKPGLFGLIRIQQSSLPIPSTLWARCHPVPPSATGDVEGPGGHRPWQLAGAPGAPTQQPKLCPAQKLRVEFSATSDVQFLFLNDKNWCQKVSRTVQSNGILERDFVTCLPASGWGSSSLEQTDEKSDNAEACDAWHSRSESFYIPVTLGTNTTPLQLSLDTKLRGRTRGFPWVFSWANVKATNDACTPQTQTPTLAASPHGWCLHPTAPKTLNPSVTQGTPATTKNLRRLGSNCGTMMFQIRKLQKKSSVD